MNNIKVYIFLLLWCGVSCDSEKEEEWAVVVPGGSEEASDIATKHGIILREQVSIGKKHKSLYRFSARNIGETRAQEISKHLDRDPRVQWVVRQDSLSRERKYILPGFDRKLKEEVFSRQKRNHIDVNCLCKNVSNFPEESFGSHVYEVMDRQSDPSLAHMFDDPKWPCQWELYNCGQTSGPHRVDLNVVPCWEKGITGKGVVISVVDDGLDYQNRDLAEAFNERASKDFNENNDRDGPMPDKKQIGNDHGTKCGGEIAMQPNNGYCGVGVAYDATLGGIRFLDGVVTDTSEAGALIFEADYIDIYSCSWGPQDNGETWEGPGKLASAALEVGSQEGRGGLGSIYIWAAGNGGAADDHCGADGYTCSIYTIGIASVSDQGLSTFYTEPCPCIMAVTLNGGPHHTPKSIVDYQPMHYVVTTDPYEGCVNTFSGTSSAAPLASGVTALMLQANPRLTWRDVQHIIARHSKIPNPTEVGWVINGAGLHVHHKYGFGLMDAAKLVLAAQNWQNVDEQRRCEVEFPNVEKYIPSGGSDVFSGHTNACSKSPNRVQELEHVQVIMTYYMKCRGDVSIDVISPCGTRSQLIGARALDDSSTPVKQWAFMTVHSWGEDPRGIWKIEIKDNKGYVKNCIRTDKEKNGIFVEEIRLVFWGTRGKKWKAPGCVPKERIVQQLEETNNRDNDPVDVHPKVPLDVGERLDQEIVEAEFIGEQDKPITANDLENPDQQGAFEPQEIPPKRTKSATEELRRQLLSYLHQGYWDDEAHIENQRDELPLLRSARKMGY